MWQKCPICNGTGCDPNVILSASTFPKCPTCNGKRIISRLDGQPPVGDVISPVLKNLEMLTDTGISFSSNTSVL